MQTETAEISTFRMDLLQFKKLKHGLKPTNL